MLKRLTIYLFFIFSFLFFISEAYASTLYLSPGNANIPQGSIRSVIVGINTAGESVNGVAAYLSYPTDKLEVAWITYGSRFDIAAEGTYGGGSIRISRGSVAGVVGNVTIATIGFRGKALGSAGVAFIGGSAAPRTSDSSDSLNLGGSAGGAYTVVAPVPVSPTPTGQQKEELSINNVEVTDISTNSATITWMTNQQADSTVEYGLSADNFLLSFHDEALTTSHSAKLEGDALAPGAIFHFRVKSKDSSDKEATSTNYSFQLKGYEVRIRIIDPSGNPISDKDVILYSETQTSRTDANGEVVFRDVTPGKHSLVVKIDEESEETSEIEVADSPLSQSFTVTVGGASGIFDYGTLILIIIIALILAIIVGIVYFIRRRRDREGLPQSQDPSVTAQEPIQTPDVQTPQSNEQRMTLEEQMQYLKERNQNTQQQ